MIIRKKFIDAIPPITIFKNLAEDPELTDRARGLYLRLFMVRDGEPMTDEFHNRECGGIVAVVRVMKELEKKGYIQIKSKTNSSKSGRKVVNHCFLKGGPEDDFQKKSQKRFE